MTTTKEASMSIELTCRRCGAHSTIEIPVPDPQPEPADAFTAADLLAVIREACVRLDPTNAAAYRSMGAEHVREAVRVNTRLLMAHREYARVYRITKRGRRQHAEAVYRWLDVVPQPYLVVAEAWALLPTALLNPPEPDPSRRSPLRTDNGHGAGGGVTPPPPEHR